MGTETSSWEFSRPLFKGRSELANFFFQVIGKSIGKISLNYWVNLCIQVPLQQQITEGKPLGWDFCEADTAEKSKKESKIPPVSENLLNVLTMYAAANFTCFIQTKMHFEWVLGNCLVWVLLGLEINCARYCTKSAERWDTREFWFDFFSQVLVNHQQVPWPDVSTGTTYSFKN